MSALRKDLRAICAEGTASSVMVGAGETYLPAFVLALTASQLACGLVASVPLIAGALLQLVSPYVMRYLHSYRRWVVLCAIVQAASLLLLCLTATSSSTHVMLVFVLASVYWGAGMAGGPAWNTWVGRLVPGRLRARFFARRTRLCQLGLLTGFLAGGIILQVGTRENAPLTAFALVFLGATISRVISAGYLGRQQDARSSEMEMLSLRPGKLLQSLKENANGRLLAYLLVAQMAVQISGPYFTPYMLGQLEMSYLTYILLSSAAYMTKIVCLPALGRLADRWGTTQLLWISGVAIAPLPAMWMINDSIAYLFLLQVYSGAVWAGFELAMLLLFFESIPSDRRISILTIFNLANASAIVLGSILGGVLLGILGTYRETYLVIFLASSLARGAALLLLVRMPQVKVKAVSIPTRPLAMRPAIGSMERPVLAGMDRAGDKRFRKDASESLPQPAILRPREKHQQDSSHAHAASSLSPSAQ